MFDLAQQSQCTQNGRLQFPSPNKGVLRGGTENKGFSKGCMSQSGLHFRNFLRGASNKRIFGLQATVIARLFCTPRLLCMTGNVEHPLGSGSSALTSKAEKCGQNVRDAPFRRQLLGRSHMQRSDKPDRFSTHGNGPILPIQCLATAYPARATLHLPPSHCSIYSASEPAFEMQQAVGFCFPATSYVKAEAPVRHTARLATKG